MRESTAMLNHRAINGWNLFWLVSLPMSLVMVIEMASVDLSTGPGVSHLISYSVRFAVPFIYLVTAASALPVLFPGTFSTWLLRNRKYIGMCFAMAMAWQGLFIFMMSNVHRDYYFEEIYFLRDELEGSTGYIFLTAMVLIYAAVARKAARQGTRRVFSLGVSLQRLLVESVLLSRSAADRLPVLLGRFPRFRCPHSCVGQEAYDGGAPARAGSCRPPRAKGRRQLPDYGGARSWRSESLLAGADHLVPDGAGLVGEPGEVASVLAFRALSFAVPDRSRYAAFYAASSRGRASQTTGRSRVVRSGSRRRYCGEY